MKNFFNSFIYALKGLRFGLGERNLRIHVFIAVVAILLGIFFALTSLEWAILILCISVVLGAELINTAVEELADAILETNKETYFKLGPPRDLLAGAVLVLSIASVVIGVLLFLPHFLILFHA